MGQLHSGAIMLAVHWPVSPARAAFAVLLEAHALAVEMASNPWDFAVERQTLIDAGVSHNQLRHMLANRCLAHGVELEPSEKERRPIRTTDSFRFSDNSCFILTDSGLAHVAACCPE